MAQTRRSFGPVEVYVDFSAVVFTGIADWPCISHTPTLQTSSNFVCVNVVNDSTIVCTHTDARVCNSIQSEIAVSWWARSAPDSLTTGKFGGTRADSHYGGGIPVQSEAPTSLDSAIPTKLRQETAVHPVSVRRFPSFRTQPLDNLSQYQ